MVLMLEEAEGKRERGGGGGGVGGGRNEHGRRHNKIEDAIHCEPGANLKISSYEV